MIAWPVLGERPTWLRTVALVMAFAGLAAIMGGNGITATTEKLPGILMALTGAIGFALGTVLAKRLPLPLPPIPAAAWQIGLGCFPIVILGLAFETTHIEKVTQLGWWLLVYSTVIQFCIAYVSWFAALARLPASVAAIGTMAVPVIGVVASAIALGEPLGLIQIVALVFTLAGVVLATRSYSGCNACRFAVGIGVNGVWHNGCQTRHHLAREEYGAQHSDPRGLVRLAARHEAFDGRSQRDPGLPEEDGRTDQPRRH